MDLRSVSRCMPSKYAQIYLPPARFAYLCVRVIDTINDFGPCAIR
jgi:hypothetical protein